MFDMTIYVFEFTMQQSSDAVAHLHNVHHKINIHFLEEVFNISSNLDELIRSGYFECYSLTPVEEEIIKFALSWNNPRGFMLIKFANTITKWLNPYVKSQFGGNFIKVLDYLKDCAQNQRLFELKREPGTEGKDEVFWLSLNKEHNKVRQVISKLKK